jgi:DnaJ-class molecular chaperone
LGIGQKATTEQIKKAYHQKMREYHPDKHNTSDFGWVKEEASRMTQMIQEAYSVLSDPQKRRQSQS